MKGKCLCGKCVIEIKENSTPLWSGYCHCNSCRVSQGAPVTTDMAFPASALTLPNKDLLGSFRVTEKGPERTFCKECGTRMYIDIPVMGAIATFHTLFENGIQKYPPTLHVNYGEKLVSMKDGLPKFKFIPSPDPKVTNEMCEE